MFICFLIDKINEHFLRPTKTIDNSCQANGSRLEYGLPKIWFAFRQMLKKGTCEQDHTFYNHSIFLYTTGFPGCM
jgi:hypothetical protein